jgi:hypothetical protein
MKSLFFLLVSFTFLAQAQDFCEINVPQPEFFIPSDGLKGDYWTNMMGEDIVMFTPQLANGNTEYPNAYNLKTKESYKLTGEIDPFPVPDGRRIYIHPGPVRFYEFDKVVQAVKSGKNPLEMMRMPDEDLTHYKKEGGEGDAQGWMYGEYQSVGVVKSEKNASTYRVLTGGNEGAFKDYKIIFGKNDEIKSITSVSKPRLVCPELRNSSKVDLNFDTPIISPKGNEFAITDRKSKTTKILSFDPKTGKCSLALDLGFEAGKLHFNKDGSKIAFHTQALRVGNRKISSSYPQGYMLDRKTKKMISLKVGKTEEHTSESFPVFLKDDKILYQQVRFDPQTGKQHRAWVIVDPKKINNFDFTKTRHKDDCFIMDENAPLALIGKLYKEVCKNVPSEDEISWSINLDPQKCKALIEAKSEIVLPAILSQLKFEHDAAPMISKELLLAACPSHRPIANPNFIKSTGTFEENPIVIQNRCASCHYNGSSNGHIPFENLSEIKKRSDLIEQINSALDNKKMPPNGPPLTKDEIKAIRSWLNN